MRIVLATPLYPPETADAAVYAKELARRLTLMNHKVTVVAYTHLPEQQPNVTVIAIDKHQRRLARLRAFLKAFNAVVKNADAVLAINGASVELPLLLVARDATTPLVFCVADTTAHACANLLEHLAFKHADHVLYDLPPRRPEILPFKPEPTVTLATYETAWATHLSILIKAISHEE